MIQQLFPLVLSAGINAYLFYRLLRLQKDMSSLTHVLHEKLDEIKLLDEYYKRVEKIDYEFDNKKKGGTILSADDLSRMFSGKAYGRD